MMPTLSWHVITSGAAIDDKVGIMTTIFFQWCLWLADIFTEGASPLPVLCTGRLFHSLLAQPPQQAFACCQGRARGLSVASEKNGGNFHQPCEATIHCSRGNLNQNLDEPIMKGWCQPIEGHGLYPPDRPNAIRLGLCNSLVFSVYTLPTYR